ncbi:MAG: hypothetical protein ACREOO_04475 [bacterium]
MNLRDALQKTKLILLPENALPVEMTCASELQKTCSRAEVARGNAQNPQEALRVAVVQNASFDIAKIKASAPKNKHWAYVRVTSNGAGELLVSHPALLFAYTTRLLEDWDTSLLGEFEGGKYYAAALRWHRPLFDYLLTQTWRTARNFNAEEHIRELARAGYTHVEVNGLAMPVPFEDPVEGEYYSQFYSYCPALDQFVHSELNKGLYPVEHLTANLNLLKRYAELGRKYGLEPGLLCFEPRSVPEKFFYKYPTLRGARVDHPFRSRRPRFTMTNAHPLVQAHYREMMQKLLREVPDLAYLSIWSNDSGSGFEYTSSLYVGRNGGPYLIREWRTHEQIAEVAGKNVVRYMKILREAAAELNPNFRVSLRLEPFKVEHDVILSGLEDHLDLEVPSLLVRGYDLPYHHDKYPDVMGIAGSVHHLQMETQERELIHEHQKRGIASHLIYSHGNGYNFEPLLGLPYPWMIWQKLQEMKKSEVEYAANLGGFTPARLAPYHINQEVFRAFMLDPNAQLEEVLQRKAAQWVGEKAAEQLLAIWQQTDETIQHLPTLPLFSNFGFVWLRLWVRPIIPDLLAIPDKERRYYEQFMVSTTNNTNLVDLGKDVLFELVTPESGEKFVQRVDEHVWPRLERVLSLASAQAGNAQLAEHVRRVFIDQHERLRGLRCWVATLRSLSAWVAGVHGYLGAKDQAQKQNWRKYLDDMMARDLRNTKDLLELWESSTVDFMVVSKTGETSFIYGENLGELLRYKIALVEKYRHVEPRIDMDIMWKV